MKTLTSCLLTALVLFLCGPVFADAQDCSDAVASCKKKCGEVKVWDYEVKAFTTDTVFQEVCENVCGKSLKPCQEQSSTLACQTFVYHCISKCPWSVRHKNTSEMNQSTDAFYECTSACAAGQGACNSMKHQLYQQARPRTGTFETCTEAQSACYAKCMWYVPYDAKGIKIPSEFPDLCAKACAAGVDRCNERAGNMCDMYFGECANACPDVVYDDVDGFLTDSNRGKACMQCCETGTDYCKKLL